SPASSINQAWGVVNSTAHFLTDRLDDYSVTWILAIFVIGYVFYAGARSKKQVVINAFTDNTGPDSASPIGKVAGGTNTMLTVELNRLRQLYSEVDDRRAIPSEGGGSGSLDYTIQAGAVGVELDKVISADYTVSLGPIKVPAGVIAAVFSKIFSGPQITGSYHKDGSLVTLNAFITGNPSTSWRVEGRIGAGENEVAEDTGVERLAVTARSGPVGLVIDDKNTISNLDEMVKELACRIFTDLSPGTNSWRARYAFAEGLREYRSCLLSRKYQIRNLKNAERRFLEAAAEDNTFEHAWYNLGVVYTELDDLDAAEQAFFKAVEMNPGRWNSYYALALNRFKRLEPATGYASPDSEEAEQTRQKPRSAGWYIGLREQAGLDETKLRDVIHPCEQAVRLNPDNPHLHILLGVCYRALSLSRRANPGSPDPSGNSGTFMHTAEKHHRIAARRAWHQLCSREIGRLDPPGVTDENLRKVTTTALWDLSRTFLADAICTGECMALGNKIRLPPNTRLWPVAWLLDEGIFIDKTNATLLKSRGIVSYYEGDFEEAGRFFEAATQTDPVNLHHWLLLALAAQQANQFVKRDFALGKILQYPGWMGGLAPQWKKEMRDILPAEGTCRDLLRILQFIPDYYAGEGRSPWDDHSQKLLHELLNQEDPPDLWEAVCQLYHLADTAVPGIKIDCYKRALTLIGKLPVEYHVAATWARGILYYQLAKIADQYHDYYKERKTDLLRVAYCGLKDVYPREVKEKKIDLKYVDSLADQGWFRNAIGIATTEAHANPIGFNELRSLGTGLLGGGEYTRALSAFESALLIDPFDPYAITCAGYCYLALGDYCETREERDNHLMQAIRYFEDNCEAGKIRNARKSDDSMYGFLSWYYLGICWYRLSDYGKAVTNYDLARFNVTSDDDELECLLGSAEASLHKRDFNRSERDYKLVIERFTGSNGERVPSIGDLMRPTVPAWLRTPTYMGVFYVQALLGLAYMYTERDAGFDKAGNLIAEAESQLAKIRDGVSAKLEAMGNEKGSPEGGDAAVVSDPLKVIEKEDEMEKIRTFLSDKVSQLEAYCHDRRGWLAFKTKVPGNLENARKEIQLAIDLMADPDFYLHLAYVYEAMAREPVTEIKKDPESVGNESGRAKPDSVESQKVKADYLIRLAIASCDRVIQMDTRKNLGTDAKTLLDKLEKLPPKPPGE
ncbi:MAG: tetratricopeptide repeat protein, partial [Methanoregulaceae archaeon]|nr:tetratricopeptide repeat protein [Methanoregulaceae archaeon]